MKKVYILTVTAGAGHLRAAEALKKAFLLLRPEWDVKLINVLDFTNPWFKKIYANSYLNIVNQVPEFWGLLYDRTDDKNIVKKTSKMQSLFNKISAIRLIEYIRKNPPDIAICTHFLPAEILASQKTKHKIRFPWVCVVTDYEAHMFWIYPNADIYIAATEHTKFQLRRNGISEKKILPLGIPIDPIFSQKKSKELLFKKFELKSALRIVLVMSGGFGAGPVENIVEQLQMVDFPIQIMVVTGRNKQLEEKLKVKKRIKPTKIFGFVDNIDELLTVADLLVSKAGGLTTSEALAKGVPMVIVNPTPGQEERNSDYILEHGAGIRVNKIDDLGFRVESVLCEKQRLNKMKLNAFKIGKPLSAITSAKEIIKRLL
ncbi:MAG TPA: hypothetical protein DCP53_01060 [Elusimicrobia bacterium]|nr:MAG: hypothetical protein A2551_00255 [Elusimicrobia bacterium RIFOXYD2_FULL_34_30]HAM37979.1 hypothetical protein [Elusimicrobiota bacterium]